MKKDPTTHQRRPIQLRLEIIDELLGGNKRRGYEELLEAVNDALENKSTPGISERTLKYDIAYLINKKEAPIHRPTKTDNRIYYTEEFSIKDLPITEEEVSYLRRAIDILKQVNNFQVLGEVEVIIQKLENRVNTFSADSNIEYIQFEKQPLVKGSEYIDDLLEAIKAKSSIKLTYQPFNFQEPEESIVFPYLLKEYRNRWFLFGSKCDDKKITTFALDRIQSIKNSALDFEATSSFDPVTYFKHLVGVSLPYDAIPEKIILKVDNSCAPYIRTKKLHESQEIIKEYKQGGIKIELFLIINYEVKSLILSYGDGIEVLEPSTLRQEIKRKLESAIRHYEDHQ